MPAKKFCSVITVTNALRPHKIRSGFDRREPVYQVLSEVDVAHLALAILGFELRLTVCGGLRSVLGSAALTSRYPISDGFGPHRTYRTTNRFPTQAVLPDSRSAKGNFRVPTSKNRGG